VPGMNKAQSGQLGGFQTFLRYGSKHMAKIGELGGRPRLPSIQELRQQSAPEIANTKKEGMVTQRSFSLKKLKELWKEKGESFAASNSPLGGKYA